MIVAAALGGLAAGVAHTLLGPDHLAAVAVFSTQDRRPSGRTGLTWGLGHAAGALVIGLIIMALREALHIELFSSIAERMVGVVLIGVGLWGLYQALGRRVHLHGHFHDGGWHVHHHVHGAEELERHAPRLEDEPHSPPHDHTHAAFGVGMLSGLAGASHILGVSPALAMPTAVMSAVYLGAFAVGSVVSMTLFSMAAGSVSARLSALAGRGLMGVISAAAVVVGVVWLVI
ncbi:MAG: sulfite exporter TauE/SafE family protein [Nitrospinota bacterium]|nr:sulfite exporter TauE/SafE family protein [Nitrospinota bacterium]MDH5677562.1 sulfite exporter TauE/SafE family protein [Nitrospinota bacterium]MDH5755739.1 sulfite exporter TauE/SafE family protein [Nitrospinota bacterium]